MCYCLLAVFYKFTNYYEKLYKILYECVLMKIN